MADALHSEFGYGMGTGIGLRGLPRWEHLLSALVYLGPFENHDLAGEVPLVVLPLTLDCLRKWKNDTGLPPDMGFSGP